MDFQLPPDRSNYNLTKVGWTDEPPGRGTLSILISCISTLVLCVYSAIHLNLPSRNEGRFQYMWRHFKWSLIGIFGPELVVWTAWRQFISAKTLQVYSQTHGRWLPLNRKDNQEPSRVTWTLQHGFYAGMGGLVIELDSAAIREGPPFIEGLTRLTLTPRGVDLLGQCGLLPKTEESEISDKSKEDGLGKAVAYLQAAWLIVQVISRLVLKLPITLLEVNTLGHVICALIVYAMWWHKPRWILEPTRLDGDWVRPVCAFMYMNSRISGQEDLRTGILRDFGTKPEVAYLAYYPGKAEKDADTAAPQVLSALYQTNAATDTTHELDGRFDRRPNLSPSKSSGDGADVERAARDAEPVLDQMTRERWKPAAEAVSRFPAIENLLTRPLSEEAQAYTRALRTYPEIPARFKETKRQPSLAPVAKDWFICEAGQLVTDSESNWPSDDIFRDLAGLVMGSILWFSSVSYSAVHLAAWNATFPSVVEQWMWRSASLYIGFSGVLWTCIHLLAQLSRHL